MMSYFCCVLAVTLVYPHVVNPFMMMHPPTTRIHQKYYYVRQIVHPKVRKLPKRSCDDPARVRLPKAAYSDIDNDVFTISAFSLREIAGIYEFPLHFLANFAAQSGCDVPVQMDTPLKVIMNESQQFELLRALTSLDPTDTFLGFNQLSVGYFADKIKVNVKTVLEVCDREGIRLPHGEKSVLSDDVLDDLKTKVEYYMEARNKKGGA